MTQYQYEMTWYPDGSENIIKCNEPRPLLDTLQIIASKGIHVEVIDGFTGELLCAQNCADPYMQEAFWVMVLGRLMEKLMG